jgi:hypothetical protein
MKQWHVTFIGAVIMLVAGIIMLVYANSLEIPTTFLGYNDYYLVSNQYVMAFLAGTLFIGFGGGLLVSSLLIYVLEKRIEPKTQQEIPQQIVDAPSEV